MSVKTGRVSLADTKARVIYRIEGTLGDSGNIKLDNGHLDKGEYVVKYLRAEMFWRILVAPFISMV